MVPLSPSNNQPDPKEAPDGSKANQRAGPSDERGPAEVNTLSRGHGGGPGMAGN